MVLQVEAEKEYTIRLTRRQIEALHRAAVRALAGLLEPQDLIGLCNGKNELAAMLAAIDNHEPMEEELPVAPVLSFEPPAP